MSTVFQDAVEKIQNLSEERQAYAAEVLQQIANSGDTVYALSDAERALVREGLADLNAGRIVSEEEMAAFWNRHKA